MAKTTTNTLPDLSTIANTLPDLSTIANTLPDLSTIADTLPDLSTIADTLLDLSTITEPFDLATALVYMKENGEFIRCKSDTQDFYMYCDVQKRPTVVNRRRQFVDVESVWAYNQWGGVSPSINVAGLFKADYYIMKFDENRNPDWSDPTVGAEV